jgi:hypothetical protein
MSLQSVFSSSKPFYDAAGVNRDVLSNEFRQLLISSNPELDGAIISNAYINNSIIVSTPIGIGNAREANFTILQTFDNVKFYGSNQEYVSWDINNNLFYISSDLQIDGCSQLGNIKICDNTIRATNPNTTTGNINIIPNQSGSINLLGPTNIISSSGNFNVSMTTFGSTINMSSYDDVNINSSHGTINLSAPNGIYIPSNIPLVFHSTSTSISGDGNSLVLNGYNGLSFIGPTTFGNNLVLNQNLTVIGPSTFSDVKINNSINYSFEKYTLGNLDTIRSPSIECIISLFSITGINDTTPAGTMPSINVPDGTFKILVARKIDEGCTYTVYFDRLITPNPLNSQLTQATKLVFKRRSQSAQLIYDIDYDENGGAWLLLTAGAYAT